MFRRSLLLAVLFAGSSHLVTSAASHPGCQLTNMHGRFLVNQAIDGALRTLAKPDCDRLFDDFSDGGGRTLREALTIRNLTGAELLGRVRFVDGDGMTPCSRYSGLAAFTAPGSHVVYVCTGFTTHLRDQQKAAIAIVIHELLHTAGLGENPPSSEAITAQVFRRCFA